MDLPELELADWRRRVAELYSVVRAEERPERAHEIWRLGRDVLFRTHPQSPLARDDPLRGSGLPYWPYNPLLRFQLPIRSVAEEKTITVATDDRATTMRLIGRIELPESYYDSLDVWWLDQYGGGIFLPLRDSTAGISTYGGGRYCLDTAKGADLGGDSESLVVDLNFLYHPSCRYSPEWICPLAPAGNWIDWPIEGGERL
jgi:uncharacterized protein